MFFFIFPENRLSFQVSLFSWKIKKSIINLSTAEFAYSLLSVKGNGAETRIQESSDKSVYEKL